MPAWKSFDDIDANFKGALFERARREEYSNGQAIYMAGDENGSNWEAIPGLGSVRWAPPEISFMETMTLHWGGEPIILQSRTGPTPGAIWVVLPEAKVVFVGDAVLKGQPPFMAHADLQAWIEALDALQGSDFKGFTIVSGRGGVVTHQVVKTQADFLKKAHDKMEKLGGKKAGSTLALGRRQYHLRGCRPLTPNERDYRHCLFAHLKYCTAPCIANVTREQYLDQVNAACAFLEGQCEEMRDQLAEEMKRAAAAQEFERAAQLRDLFADLQRTTRKVNRFERVPYSLPQAIEPERDLAELAAVLGLPAPPERIEGFDISNISGTFKVASLVSFWRGRPDRSNYRRFRIKTVECFQPFQH